MLRSIFKVKRNPLDLKLKYHDCKALQEAKTYYTPPEGIILNENKTSFGCLGDEDRVFQNLYGRHDWRLGGACKRGDWHRTKDLICQGPDWILEQVGKAGLRGRGGAGVYTVHKLNFIKECAKSHPKMLVINAAEGEPGTCKDREILRHEPHKVIEGLLLAGFAMGIDGGIIYVRSRYYNEVCNLQLALTEAYRYGLIGKNACGAGYKFNIRIQRGSGYVCGEERALVRCLMGELGRPTKSPPHISTKGYFDMPTVVVNTETIATLPTLLRRGACWYASLGRSCNSGTKLFNISGDVTYPCTVEEEMSIPMRLLIEKHAGGVMGGWDNLRAVFPGGTSSALIGPDVAENVLMDFDCLTHRGSAMGTGAVIVISKYSDLIKVIHRAIKFYKHETCKQCTPCRDGSVWLTEIFGRFVDGNAQVEELKIVEQLSKWMDGPTICALSGAQANVARAMLEFCKEDLEDRIKTYGKC